MNTFLIIPNPPYPKCPFYTCSGVLLPTIEPETGLAYHVGTIIIPNTITLRRKCQNEKQHPACCLHYETKKIESGIFNKKISVYCLECNKKLSTKVN